MNDDKFDKQFDLHPTEWKSARRKLPFTWLDIQIWTVYIVVGLVASYTANAAVDWMWPPPVYLGLQ